MRILTEGQKEKARTRAKKWNDEHREERLAKAKLNYEKNRDKRLEYRKQYYENNKEECSMKMKAYWDKNKERLKMNNMNRYWENKITNKNLKPLKIKIIKHKKKSFDQKQYMKEYNKMYRERNNESLKQYKKEWQLKNKERLKIKSKMYYINNKEKHSKYSKEWYQKNKYKIALKSRNEGRSGKHVSNDLYLAMLNVRIRDNNTCQWFGCGLKHKVTEVHVHHIFPRSEYPELELIEQYMICYCAEHHAQFHAARGDYYHKLIKNQRKIIPNADHVCNEFETLGDVS